MGAAGIRNIAVFGLAFGLCLDFSGSPGTAAEYERAVEQVAQNAPLLAHGQPAREQAVSDRGDKPPTGEELKELFSGLLDGIRENDSEAVSARIDSDRMLNEIERQRIVSVPTPSEKTALRVALKMVVGNSLMKEGADGGWKDFRLHRVGTESGATPSIYVHVVSKEGKVVGLVQFWLTRDSKGDLKIFDWQEASSIFKISTMIAVTVSAFREEPGSASLQRLVAAAKAASQGNIADSERIVLELANQRLPDALEAPRWLLYAQIKFSQGQPDKSLECLEQAAKYDPHMVALPKLKALLYAEKKNPARSLEFADQALKALGNDAEVYSIIGNAHSQLGHADEAATAYRKGLDADPNLLVNLVGLAGALPAGEKGEVATRLSRCTDPGETFPALAEALVAAGDKESLRQITDEKMKPPVDDAVLEYYRARSASLDGQPATATKLLKTAIDRAPSGEARRFYGDKLLDLQLEAGHSLEAYQDSAEPEYDFTYLAHHLSEGESADQLLALSESHLKRVPTSAEGFFYRGRALLLEEQYDEAGKAFAKGLGLTKSPPQRESFRSNLVFALYKAGKGLSAYQDVGPARSTLDQLGGLYLGNKEAEPLLKLVAAARKDDVENPSLDYWEAEGKMLLNDYSGAADLLKAGLAKAYGIARKKVLARKLLDARLAGKAPAQGYAEALDKDFAFGYLGEALVKDGDVSGLNAVIEAHRAKAPRDPRLLYYSGQAHMLTKDYRAAENDFAAGLKQSTNRPAAARFLTSLLRARSQLGEALKAYQESDDKPLTYRLLAPLLVELNRADDLAALVKAHRGVAPKEPTLGLGEAESLWLTHDYQGVVGVLDRDRDAIMADPDNAPWYEDRLIRSLIRLKKFDAAARAAKGSTDRDGDPLFEAVVAIASGDVCRAGPLLERCAALGYSPDKFDADVDAGPIFKSPAFRELRKKLATSE